MEVLRYENSLDYLDKDSFNNSGVIFLAGPTVRGNQQHLTSWRFEAIEEFKKQGFDGTLILPEFVSKTESDKHRPELPLWEYKGLSRSSVILFWIPRSRELIGLTTNQELGYWMAKDFHKLVYGRPDDAYRIAYQDIMWKEEIKNIICSDLESDIKNYTDIFYKSIYNTLSDTVKASIELDKELDKMKKRGVEYL